MLLGSPRSSTPIYSTFTPYQVNLLLDALTRLINPKVIGLFRVDLSSEKMIKFERDLFDVVNNPIQARTGICSEAVETIVNALNVSDDEKNLYCGHFLKQILIKGNLLVRENLETEANWNVFLIELRTLLAMYKETWEQSAKEKKDENERKYPEFIRIDQKIIANMFFKLCGQLLRNGGEIYVRLTHQVIHYIKQNALHTNAVLQAKRQCEGINEKDVKPDEGGMLIGGILTHFLRISGHIDDVLPKVYNTKAIESFFMKYVGVCLVTNTIFDEPFGAATHDFYLEYFQNKALMTKACDILLATRLAVQPWGREATLLNSPRPTSSSSSSSSLFSIFRGKKRKAKSNQSASVPRLPLSPNQMIQQLNQKLTPRSPSENDSIINTLTVHTASLSLLFSASASEHNEMPPSIKRGDHLGGPSSSSTHHSAVAQPESVIASENRRRSNSTPEGSPREDEIKTPCSAPTSPRS